MFWFIVACILALICIVAVAAAIISKDDDVRAGSVAAAIVTFLLAGGIMFASCATTVDTKNVGVLTTFGRPSGHIDNGFHFIAPWQNVTELNDAIQTDTYASDEGSSNKQGGATDTCVHVRIERQATACVNVSIKWQIRPDGVDYLFRNYKDNGSITDNLVLRNLQQALNVSFQSYDPLGLDANGKNTNPALTTYSTKVRHILAGANGHSGDMGKWIDVQSVIVPILNYDSSTQGKVNQLLQQIALTRVANQSISTAQAQSKANAALQKSVANNPNVLIDKCLNLVKTAIDEGKVGLLPAGFNCFSNQTATSIPLK